MAKRRRFTPDYPTGAEQETSALGVRVFDSYGFSTATLS